MRAFIMDLLQTLIQGHISGFLTGGFLLGEVVNPTPNLEDQVPYL